MAMIFVFILSSKYGVMKQSPTQSLLAFRSAGQRQPKSHEAESIVDRTQPFTINSANNYKTGELDPRKLFKGRVRLLTGFLIKSWNFAKLFNLQIPIDSSRVLSYHLQVVI